MQPCISIEHVQAVTTIRLTAGMRKDLSMTLTSPAGTQSILLPYRQRDRHREGFHSWPFMTVHSWGEQPRGNWIFSIHVLGESKVKLESLQLILYGTQFVPPSVLAIPKQLMPFSVQVDVLKKALNSVTSVNIIGWWALWNVSKIVQ